MLSNLEKESRSMRLVHYFVLALSITINASYVNAVSSFDSNDLIGVWKEKDGSAIYSFQKEHEFEFQYTYPSGKTDRTLGVWQTESEIGWVGNDKRNLTIHAKTNWCCHASYFLGKNLVLRGIKSNYINICVDRVLIRTQNSKDKTR